MPLYQYTCDNCGKSFELFQVIKERDHPTLQGCSLCLTGTVKRDVSKCTFRLGSQGSVGWAANGYAENTLGNDPTWRKGNRG